MRKLKTKSPLGLNVFE